MGIPMTRRRVMCFLLALILLLGTPLYAFAAQPRDMTVSEDGLSLIKALEGFSSQAYQDSTGWYIGYGTSCSPSDYPAGITEDQAEALLVESLAVYEKAINSFTSQNEISLTQNEIDALASFTYNLGESWMTDSDCRLAAALVSGAASFTDAEIVNFFGVWCHIGTEISPALAQRRVAEACVFLYADYEGDSADNFVSLTLDKSGGTLETDIVFYEKGQPYSALPSAQRDGYELTGWKTSDNTLLSASGIALTDLAVSAVWLDITPWVNPYSDVAESDWFYAYVKDLSRSGVVDGYPDGTFTPGGTVTLGAALKLVMLAAGYSEQAPTGIHWASGYLTRAISDRLLSSSDAGDLDGAASRLLIAQIAARALGLYSTQSDSPFADTDNPSVLALFAAGIVEGSYSGDGALVYKPDSTITRSEISAIVWRMTGTDIYSGMIQYNSYWADILDGVPVNAYDAGSFYSSGGRIGYNSESIQTYTGIDVSYYQGDIDWNAVAAAGVDYAIIRLGYRGYGESGSLNLDTKFEDNITGALAAGLDTGVYFFSQAITVEEAVEEAEFVLSYLNGYDLTYPVVFDWELTGVDSARTNNMDAKTLTRCAEAFCDKIAEAGYTPMIYFTSYVGYFKYDLSWLLDYGFWFAQYSDVPAFYYDFQIWQYSDTGKVNGISGNVDLNISFVNYAA